jgi:toxin-antitoxin system PIN domain toxin
MAFLRIVTNPRIYPNPKDMPSAWRQVSNWLANEIVWTPGPTDRHSTIYGNLIETHGITAPLVTDAHLAAIAIEHGLTLCSADGDFARFKNLRWRNPIA